jgi:hypothetical protein
MLEDEPASPSIADSMSRELTGQLGRLYEPVGDEPDGIAPQIGFECTVETLARTLLDELAYLIGLEAPADAAALHAFRHDWVMLASPAMGRERPADLALVRFVLCRSFDAIAEIASRHLAVLPAAKPVLLENEVSSFWRALVEMNGGPSRAGSLSGAVFESRLQYLEAFDGARLTRTGDCLPYFDVVRPCSTADTVLLRESDPVSGRLLSLGLDPTEVSLAVGHYEYCGASASPPFVETLLVRPVWALLLEVVVTSHSPIALEAWTFSQRSVGDLCSAQYLSEEPTDAAREDLPRVLLQQGTSVFIPLGTLLPRLPLPPEHTLREWGDSERQAELHLPHGQAQYSAEVVNGPELSVDLWGPTRVPHSLALVSDAHEVLIPVHEFDPNRTFIVDREWQIGSCPHLFTIDEAGFLTYRGSLFSRAPNLDQSHRLVLDLDTTGVVIAELEDETTYVDSVQIGGRCLSAGVRLSRGDSLRLSGLAPGSSVHLRGHYAPQMPTTAGGSTSQDRRNALVRDFMHGMASGQVGTYGQEDSDAGSRASGI